MCTGRSHKQMYLYTLSVHLVSTTRDSTRFQTDLSIGLCVPTLDVVLNSLSHDLYAPKSLELLRVGGHFSEIGKRGVMRTSTVARSHPEVCYEVLRGDTRVSADSCFVECLLDSLGLRGTMHEVHPLPIHVFDVEGQTHVSDAFLFLRHANHIGKVVVHLSCGGTQVCSANSSIAVTNGTGPLGLVISHWLAKQHTKQITLLSHYPIVQQSPLMQSNGNYSLQVSLCDIVRTDELLSCMEVGGSHLAGILHIDGKIQ